jgi:hypothetical protein
MLAPRDPSSPGKKRGLTRGIPLMLKYRALREE